MVLILSYMNTEAATLDYHYLKIIRPETKFSALSPPRGSQSSSRRGIGDSPVAGCLAV